MSSRLHNKFHRHNHHTLSSLDPRFPDSSHDPIASPNSPFQGDFVLHGSLSASTYQTSAYAATFSGNVGVNTATPNVELTVYGNVSSSDNTTTTTLSVLDSAYITNSLTVNNISPQISSPLKVNGDVTITGNLSTLGSLTYLDTVVQVMSSMTINNAGVGPALTVTQTGNQPIMVSYDDNNGIALWVDGHNASPACVGIGVSASPQAKLVVAGNIVAGTNNNTTSLSSSIFGGSNNNISSPNSFVLGGSANNTGFNNTFIIGSNLSASQDNFTYVNNLSSQGTINTNGLSAQSVTVNGVISSNNVFYSSGGNSANWNTAYTYATAYNLSASNYNNTFSTVQSNSANWILNTTTISGVNGLSGGGNLSTNQTLSLDFTRSNIWTGQQTFNTTNASTVGSIIKGTTSQTADLLQFQNSAGSVMQKIKADGTTTIIGTSATETPILGSELLTTAQWTSANWTGNFTTGFSHISSATIDSLVSNISAVKSLYYTLNITISNRTAGSVTMNFGGLSYPTIISSNIYADISTSTSPFIIIPTNDFSGTVIVSVKQIIAPSNPILSVIDSLGNTINEIRTGASTRYSTFIGVAAGGYHTKVLFPVGASNNAFGYTALQHLTMGTQNDAFGSGAGTSITSGNNNVCFGYFAGNGITTGGDNVCLGAYSAPINNGSYNISIGAYSSQSNTTGGYNTSIGNCASNKNTVGNFNVSMGNGSLFSNLSGGFNIALGNTSLYTSLGNNNIGLGAQAGYFWTGSNMLFVDSVANYNRKTVADNLSASIITGVMAVSPVNQILTFNALVGINAQSPSAQFQINPITTSTVGQIISSISGQTADLLQFRNNAGTILANINNSGALSAASITKTGGTASQFLKADGSVDSNTYLTSSGGLTLAYTAQTANYGIQSTDYLINCTTNSFSVTLPSATSIAGKVYIIKNSGTGNITILTTSSQTIDGQSSGYWIISNKNSMELMSDGANWIIT